METLFRKSLTKAFLPVLGLAILTAVDGDAQNLSKHNRVFSPSSPASLSSQPTVSPDDLTSPAAVPCVVSLFNNYTFNSYSSQSFTYTPACPGPWSKVVFKGSFNVSAGVQFDRTANIQLGYVNIYFGTTEEPSSTNAPSWKVQRDLTDYSHLFATPQTGEVDIYNIVDSTYTGVIYGTATLEFFPVAASADPPVVADAVYPLPNGPGAPYHLDTTTSQLSETFTLPTNVERAYLDVIAQSQQGDEFWYTCVPTDVSSELESCGNTAFRETEISIDGQPAGVAPIYPWIFTGGIDPYLWTPIPGVQTLNFAPYRVDLTPFAGILSNGQPHTVSIGVFNANSYFQAVGTLLVYLDHHATSVTGGLLTDTLVGTPSPHVNENLTTDASGNITGDVSVTSNRSFVIAGYVMTSHGMVNTAISQQESFSNVQNFNITDSVYVQNITQSTTANLLTSITANGITTQTTSQYHFPLTLDINEYFNDAGLVLQTTVNQGNVVGNSNQAVSQNVKTTDNLQFDQDFNLIGNSGQKSSETYSQSVDGVCSGLQITSADNAYTGVRKTTTCP